MKTALLIAVLMLSAVSVHAEPIGTVSPMGYVLQADGYWWHTGVAYVRSVVPACYSHGCYQASYYQYTAVPVVAKVNLIKAPDFESQVLGVIKAREEKAYRLKVLQSLGVNQYGVASPSYLSSIQTSGTTLYGYPSVNNYARTDQSIDVNALILQHSQAVQAGIQLGAQGQSGLQQLAQQVAGDKAANDAAQARYQLALKLIDGPPVLKTEQRKYDFSNQPPAQPQQAQPRANDSLQRLQTFFAASCAACHADSAATNGGGFDLRNWTTFSPEQKAKVMVRINLPSTDAKFMPRLVGDPSKPGQPARREEKQAVLEN